MIASLAELWLSIAPIVMMVSALFLLHTYVLFPLMMIGLEKCGFRYGPRPMVRKWRGRNDVPAVTVIIAAYNAAEHIEDKLRSCLALSYPKDRLSVLVVSDGSTDGTDGIVTRFAEQYGRVRLISNPRRRGKPACINDAVAMCNTPLLLLTDARQSLDKSAARYLASHFEDKTVAAVSGSLEIARTGQAGVVESAGAYWRMEKKLRQAESSVHSSVGVTGAIYMLRRKAFRAIPHETILDDVLIPMNAVMAGWRVLFDRRALAFDSASDTEAQERNRKIRTLAGNFQLMVLRPAVLNPFKNPLWAQFLSHKVFRVTAPVALGLFLLADAALAAIGQLWLVLLLFQLVVYGITILPESEASGRVKWLFRMFNTVRGFVRLQWYAVLGFIWFLKNRQPQIWTTTQRRAVSNPRIPAEPWRHSQIPPGS